MHAYCDSRRTLVYFLNIAIYSPMTHGSSKLCSRYFQNGMDNSHVPSQRNIEYCPIQVFHLFGLYQEAI